MIRLLLFLKKIQTLLLFLAIEIVLVNVFVSQNSYQRAKMVAASHWVIGSMKGALSSASNYFELSQQNKKLIRENAELHAKIARMESDSSLIEGQKKELLEAMPNFEENFGNNSGSKAAGAKNSGTSLKGLNSQSSKNQKSKNGAAPDINNNLFGNGASSFMVVKVVGNSFTKRNNFITIAGGTAQGIYPDMALFNSDGIVGYVKHSSENFSVAVSVLNYRDFRTSGTLTYEDSPASVYWDGTSYTEVVMDEISAHTPIKVGDTIVTTQYSNIFPQNIPIGVVTEVTKGYNELLSARLRLLADLSGLDYLYAVSLSGQSERAELEAIEKE